QQLVHVGHALIGRVEATHVRLIATPVQRPLDQARDRAGGSDAPLTREPLAEAGEALAVAIAQARAQLLEPGVQRRPNGLAARLPRPGATGPHRRRQPRPRAPGRGRRSRSSRACWSTAARPPARATPQMRRAVVARRPPPAACRSPPDEPRRPRL